MNTYQVLFLTEDHDATAAQFAHVYSLNEMSRLTPTYRSHRPAASTKVASSKEVSGFHLIIIEAEVGTMLDLFKSCRRLRSSTNAPILFVSPLDNEEYALAAYKAGADDYIIKPFSLDLLRVKLQAWLRWTVLAVKSPIIPTQPL